MYKIQKGYAGMFSGVPCSETKLKIMKKVARF